MPHFWFAVLWGTYYWGITIGSCESEQVSQLQRAYEGLQKTGRAEATKLLKEFEAEEHVATFMKEQEKVSVPSVLLGITDHCFPQVQSESSAGAAGVELPLPAPRTTTPPPIVNIDETGRPWAPCPKAMTGETPYYGHKGALKGMTIQLSKTLGDLKQTTDFTRLGLDLSFNEQAYHGLEVCKDFFFSGSGLTRNTSDPACVIAHLDESSASIKELDTSSLRLLHPKLKTALFLASKLLFTKRKREWTRKLLSSPSLRLGWHVVESFSEMNVSMLEANVGEALNHIIMKDKRLYKPLKDLIQFATTCVTHEEYPEKSWQDSKLYPNPDSPDYRNYPIYDYLRGVGAEVAFPKELPADWQPRVYDGNRTTSRAYGEREGFNFHGDWKRQVYNSWHTLWILNLIMYDAGSMWQWSHQLSASTFFFKPWIVTRVGTLKVSEAGPLRYDDFSCRFGVDPSNPPKEDNYETCPHHLTDLNFFDKVNAPKGRVTAHWHQHDLWKAIGMQREGLGHCPVSQAVVPCPPKVFPDKCGIDASYIRAVESPWLFRLEREEAWVSWSTDETQSDYANRIWAARGTSSPKLWLLNSMCSTVVDSELSPSGEGKIHSGFLFLFRKATKDMMDEDIKEVAQKIQVTGKRQVVLFTGHSLGGAVAQISAWYYARKCSDLLQSGLLQIRCVTFGAPAWGNEAAYKELMSIGVLTHDIAFNMDPVTTLNGEPAIGHGLQWRKPFHYRIMLEDMAKVVVASASPLEPDFYGQLWTRKEFHARNFLKRTFGALANMKNVDSVFLNPVLTHVLAYSSVLTIMADLVPEAGFGSGLAAPLIPDQPLTYACHTVSNALIKAETRMKLILHRIALESGIVRKLSVRKHL